MAEPDDDLFALSPDPVLVLNADGYLLRSNPAAERLLGLTSDTLRLRLPSLMNYCHADDCAALASALKRASTEGTINCVPLRFRVDDDYRWLEWRVRAVEGEAQLVATARELAEHRVVELERGETNVVRKRGERGKLDSLFAKLHLCIAILDRDFNFLRVNNAYAEVLGLAPENYVGRSHFDLHPDDESERLFHQVVSTGNACSLIAKRLEHPSLGATYWDFTLTPFEFREGEVEEMVLTLVNVTERVKAEEYRRRAETELLAAQQTAESASAVKTRFLATVSHDLRQPIQAIHLLAHLLVTSELPQTTAAIAVKIQDAVEGLSKMLNALLDISKLDSGPKKPQPSCIAIGELVRQLVDEQMPMATQRGVTLKSVESRLWVHSDRDLLAQILRNLISNAIKYTPSGGVVVGVRRAGENARIQVVDTGIGIDEAEIGHIFEEYRQVANVARDRREGLGLGLAIVKRISDLLHHPVEVASVAGRGSCFSVRVPIAVRRDPSAERFSTSSSALPSGCEGTSILVVDDEVDIRESLETTLRQWGYAVNMAGDLEQSLASVEAHGAPVLVIADYRLGQNTGIEVIHAVRRRSQREVEALLLTGDATDERVKEAARAGVKLLRKPISVETLRRAVSDCISQRLDSQRPKSLP